MIYRTLHWYILRELLRIFLMTASTLTTLMAFGGMLRPLTREGLELALLMRILTNLMPAMLAYAIPISALFAAVLVYWRMSTDNELTACRASGVSYWAMLVPAFILGLLVASIDLVFVEHVVPLFLQRTERLMRRDIGELLVATITRQDQFKDPSGRLVVYAKTAELDPSADPNLTIVRLRGMMLARLSKDGKPLQIGNAVEAVVHFVNDPGAEETRVKIASVIDGCGFDPKNFQRVAGSSSVLPEERPLILPSQLKDKPKYANWHQLQRLSAENWRFAPVQELLNKSRLALKHELIARDLLATFRKDGKAVFETNVSDRVVVTAVQAHLPPGGQLTFGSKAGAPVQVALYRQEGRKERLYLKYAVSEAELTLDSDDVSGVLAALTLRGPHLVKTTPRETISGVEWETEHLSTRTSPTLAGLRPPEKLASLAGFEPPVEPGARDGFWRDIRSRAATSPTPALQALARETQVAIVTLNHTISSELHSRASFAVSCLTLVLFGSALGIMLRGRNPLAVFVLGFVPSIVLVLLITAGRRVMEAPSGNQALGLALLWAGNMILLVLVVSTYGKLLRT